MAKLIFKDGKILSTPFDEEEEEEMAKDERGTFSCWLKKGDSLYIPSDNVKVAERLEAGAYNVQYDNYNNVYNINKVNIVTDTLIDLPQPEIVEIMDSMKKFFTQKEDFAKWGYIFKRGMLLYGIPGGGKTSIMAKIAQFAISELDAVIFTINDEQDLHTYARFLPKIFREVETDRVVIAIFEDIDGMKDSETTLINVLDGLGNNANVFNIATTNYMEKLSPRVFNRPNRFDRRFEIKSPNEEARRFYLNHRIPKEELEKIDIEKWIKETEGMTMAQINEIIKSVFLLGYTFEEVTETLNSMKKPVNSADYNKVTTGLGFITK